MEETIKTSARVNYRSDFNLILRLRSHDGTDIGFPPYDWEARFYTGLKANAFVASCRGGECVNCFNDGGRVRVVFDNHHLSRGELRVEFTAYLPNDDYPDGAEKISVPVSLGIELTREAAPCPTALEAEMVLPYIKGEPFTYEDFTPEQIAELQRPAVEAAKDALVAIGATEAATREAVAASGRADAAAGTATAAASDAAATDEAVRAAEAKRAEAESLRATAEEARETAEGKRAAEFAEIKKQPPRWLIDLFESDPNGGYERETASFKLNELTLTTQEALNIAYYGRAFTDGMYQNGPKIRTNLCLLGPWNATRVAAQLFYNQTELEVANVASFFGPLGWSYSFIPYDGYNDGMFKNCAKLHTVYGKIDCVYLRTNASLFEGCVSLRELRLDRVRRDINLGDCASLSIASMKYIVANAINDAAITITIHPDVYAKLTDGALPEWGAVLTDALAKNITFATI